MREQRASASAGLLDVSDRAADTGKDVPSTSVTTGTHLSARPVRIRVTETS